MQDCACIFKYMEVIQVHGDDAYMCHRYMYLSLVYIGDAGIYQQDISALSLLGIWRGEVCPASLVISKEGQGPEVREGWGLVRIVIKGTQGQWGSHQEITGDSQWDMSPVSWLLHRCSTCAGCKLLPAPAGWGLRP